MQMDSTNALVFDSAVEGLFHKALVDRLSPAVLERMRAEGLDLRAPLKPAYPEAAFHRCVELAAADVFGDLPRDAALERMGQEVVRGFGLTLVGAAVLAVIRLLGPLRALERMTRNFRNVSNYLETRLTRRSPTEVEVWINHTSGLPSYFAGILLRVLQSSGAKGPTVRHERSDGDGAVFVASWG